MQREMIPKRLRVWVLGLKSGVSLSWVAVLATFLLLWKDAIMKVTYKRNHVMDHGGEPGCSQAGHWDSSWKLVSGPCVWPPEWCGLLTSQSPLPVTLFQATPPNRSETVGPSGQQMFKHWVYGWRQSFSPQTLTHSTLKLCSISIKQFSWLS